MILYSDVVQSSALLATFVTAFVALAPERLKAPDYTSVLVSFSFPLALFSLAVALAIVEFWGSLLPFYGGLIALFVAFILTIQKVIEAGSVPPPPPAKPVGPVGVPAAVAGRTSAASR